MQAIIELGRDTRLHNLELPRRDYTSAYWSEVRALQSKLLLVEIKALYRKDLLVTSLIKSRILPNSTLLGRDFQSLLLCLVPVAGRTRGDAQALFILCSRVRQGYPHSA